MTYINQTMVDAKLVSLYKLLQLCDFFNTVWGFKHTQRERERGREEYDGIDRTEKNGIGTNAAFNT